MRVEPEFVDHPKYLRLKRRVGDRAAECVLRIWGHCQGSQRGEKWPDADAEYIEEVARWRGKPGELFEALKDLRFIEVIEGGIIVHDWNEMNSRTIANWTNGKNGGRPKANPKETPGLPLANFTATGSEPTANLNERVTDPGGTGGTHPPFPEYPTDEEILEFARTFPGQPASGIPAVIPADFAIQWLKRFNGRTSPPANWRRCLVADWRAFKASPSAEKKSEKRERWQVQADLDKVDAAISGCAYSKWPAGSAPSMLAQAEFERLVNLKRGLKEELKGAA